MQVDTYRVKLEIILLAGIKFGVGPQICCKNIGGFKFGVSVKDRHTCTYDCRYKILADFNLAVVKVDHLI